MVHDPGILGEITLDRAVPRRRGRPPRAGTSDLQMLPPVPPRPALHEEAYLTLRRRIIFCQLRPGDNIGEAAVSGVLGISRTPLREALKLLAAEGLVELRAHRGAFVM